MALQSANPAHHSGCPSGTFAPSSISDQNAEGLMKYNRLLNKIFKIISAGYVIVFLPLFLSYIALQYFTSFSGRMLLYALIPLAVVVLVLFVVYVVRVVRTGHFWSRVDRRENFQTLQHTDK